MSIEKELEKSVKKHGERQQAKAKAKEPEKKAAVNEMRIRHADSGGFIVEHHKENGPKEYGDTKESEHIIKNESALKKHVAEHMCAGATEAEEEKGEEK